ncbi:MAG: alpha/beta fold hydrolase [Planctomycetota bacterium]
MVAGYTATRHAHSRLLEGVSVRHLDTPDGVRLHYEVLGCTHPEAPTLLLANGLGGRLYAWEPLVERFAATHRILTWDYRGLFHSDAPARPALLGVPHHAADALRILDAEQVRRATLVGWSMGVQVSLEAALQAPGRVERLVLINGTHGQVFSTGLQPIVRIPRIQRLLHHVVERVHGGSLTARVLSTLALSEPHQRLGGTVAALFAWNRRIDDMYRQYTTDVFGPSFENFLRLFQHLDAHSVYHLLPDVSQPTLVISGGLDYLTPPAMSREIARRVPRAEHLHIRRASHFVLLEHPARVLARIESFLARG